MLALPTLALLRSFSGSRRITWTEADLFELAGLAEFGGEEALEQIMAGFEPSLSAPSGAKGALELVDVPRDLSDQEVSISTNGASQSSLLSLRKRFETLMMCDFTPRRLNELPMAHWTSYKELIRLLEPHADSTEGRHLGPGNLKQLITAWYKDDPAFAGLAPNAWCKKLTDNDPEVPARTQVFKFCFEYTPAGLPSTYHRLGNEAARGPTRSCKQQQIYN